VASEGDLPKLYRAFGFAQLPEGIDGVWENVAQKHFNTQVFDSPELREFLAYHNRHDLRLYAAVRAASWSAEGRRPFRPALLEQVCTFENFDEQTYLDYNSDVAAAVKDGHPESGRAHFEAIGYKENRMIRRWVLPPAVVSEQKSAKTDLSASSVVERLRELREERARIAAELQLRQQSVLTRPTTSTAAEL
jgi:hypothetical protein